MTENKEAEPTASAMENGKPEPGPDEMPEVRAAEEAVSRAKEELKRARGLYVDVRRQATDQIRQVRGKTVGDLIDNVLDLVKKHPGPGVVIAALLGMFLGRIFRR